MACHSTILRLNSSFPESLIHSAKYRLAPPKCQALCQVPEIQTRSKDRPSMYSEGGYSFMEKTDMQ